VGGKTILLKVNENISKIYYFWLCLISFDRVDEIKKCAKLEKEGGLPPLINTNDEKKRSLIKN
jgi:hypothetical protein